MTPAEFSRRFRLLIAATWAIPPVFGLGFLIFVVDLFDFGQLGQMLLTPPLPIYVVGAQLISDWYFRRFARPIQEYLDDPTPENEARALSRAHRFPLHFWVSFLAYLVLAPVAVMWSANLGYGFEPTRVDWFRIELVSLVVSIIVGLPIFLLAIDVFGRAFSRVHWVEPHVRLTHKVFLLGALVPLLIDTMLVQYYWTETGYFSVTTFIVWLVLELLAVAGAVLAVRSFRQALAPLDALIRVEPEVVDVTTLTPQSTDELGVLASGYKSLLSRFQRKSAILETRNALLRAAREAESNDELVDIVSAAVREACAANDAVVAIRDGDTLRIARTDEESIVLGRDRAPLLWRAIEDETVTFHDMEREPHDELLAEHLGCGAAAIAPLRADGAALGALIAIYHAAGEPPELETLEALALDAGGLLAWSLARERQRDLETQLFAAQKMEVVGRLAGGVAHDFNNLLTVVLASASLLDMQATEGQKEELHAIVDASERAAALTRQLMTFSKSQLNRPTVLDLSEVVRGVTRVLERLVPSSMTLKLELETAACRVRADRGQLEQVLLNLVVNARDAVATGGTITVTTERVTVAAEGPVPAGEWAVICVNDDGVGMPPEVLARIFEPYFSTKTTDRGTGLGLSTVYGIVSQSDGHVRVESTPGQGTVFRVYLPRTQSLEEPRNAPASTASGPTRRALLVEDEPVLREVVRRTLERSGVEVVASTGRGDDAVSLAEDDALEFDLVISDVVLPGLSGLDVVRRISELRPGCRMLLMSGYADTETMSAIAENGIPFLPKPFKPDDLVAMLAQVDETAT